MIGVVTVQHVAVAVGDARFAEDIPDGVVAVIVRDRGLIETKGAEGLDEPVQIVDLEKRRTGKKAPGT